ncbi:hypothetical protein ACTA71_001251 [Dictyostelium dimigraforme]
MSMPEIKVILSIINPLKAYFEYLCCSGKKIQDLLFKDISKFGSITLLDIINCFIFISIIKISTISLTFIFYIYSYLYVLLVILLLILFLIKIKFVIQSLNSSSIQLKNQSMSPSFTVGPYHPSVFACLQKKNSSNPQIFKSKISDNGIFYFSFLEDGSYDAEFFIQNGHPTPLLLKKLKIVKNGDQFTPDFVDLSSSVVEVSFRAFNKPVSNSQVTGTIEFANGGTKTSITSLTDGNGVYTTLLPECKYIVGVDGIVDGKPVKIDETLDIQKPTALKSAEDSKKAKPKVFEKTQTCTDYNMKSNSKKAVYLLDTSGSMSGQRLDLGKDNLKKSIVGVDQFAFGAWSDSISFYSDSWETLTSLSKTKIHSWIDGLSAGGGTDIRQAIEKGIQKYKDADEFWILCDGDTGTFPDLQSWSNFYSSNSKYIINFIGIGNSDERMKNMAQVSGKFIKVD